MELLVTESAATHIQRFAAEMEEEGAALRVAIEGGGCSGFQYALGFDTAEADDVVVEAHGVTVVVDPHSAPFLEGATIDWVDSLQSQGFKIDNPHATAACGCGSSFVLEDGDQADLNEAASCNGCG